MFTLRMRDTVEFKSDLEKWRSSVGETSEDRGRECMKWQSPLRGNFSLWSRLMKFPERKRVKVHLAVSGNDLTM